MTPFPMQYTKEKNMNKYAQEKIAQEYYQLGMQLALQNAGLGMSKTANRKNLLAGAAGLLGGIGGAAAFPSLKGLGQDAANYLREAYSLHRAPQIMEDATMARFAENLRQGNMPSEYVKNLTATEGLNAAAAREALAMEEARAVLGNAKGFAGMGGDALPMTPDFLSGSNLGSMITPLQ